MKFNFTLTKKEHQKQLEKKYFKTCLIYIILFTVLYFVVNINLLTYNFWLILITYFIYTAILSLVMFLINKLYTYLMMKVNKEMLKNIYGEYTVTINKNEIIEKVNNMEERIELKSIKSIKYTKNKITIKSNVTTTYYKKALGDIKFKELTNYLKTNVKQ